MKNFVTKKHVSAGVVSEVKDGVIITECGFTLPFEKLGNRSAGEPPKGAYLVDYRNNDYFGWCPSDVFLASAEEDK